MILYQLCHMPPKLFYAQRRQKVRNCGNENVVAHCPPNFNIVTKTALVAIDKRQMRANQVEDSAGKTCNG